MQELRNEFDKQGKECLGMGSVGEKLALSYLLTSRHCFDKALEAYKKESQEEDVFSLIFIMISLYFFFFQFIRQFSSIKI